MRFRKIPIEIEAVQVIEILRHCGGNWAALPGWIVDAHELGDIVLDGDEIRVQTIEGRMTAGINHWILRGVQGELYPCRADIFAATYEPITGETQ